MTRPSEPEDDTLPEEQGAGVREGSPTRATGVTQASDALGELVRWEAAGGEWRVSSLGPPARVSLRTCDGGEEMAQLESAHPSFVAYLEARFGEVDGESPQEPR